MKKFWFVWDQQGRAPTVKHETYLKAADEAERLARLNPGHKFHVLELIGTVCMQSLVWEGKDPSTDPDYVPF